MTRILKSQKQFKRRTTLIPNRSHAEENEIDTKQGKQVSKWNCCYYFFTVAVVVIAASKKKRKRKTRLKNISNSNCALAAACRQ